MTVPQPTLLALVGTKPNAALARKVANEAIVLLKRKRIQFKRDFGEWFLESKEELSLNEVPVSWAVAHELRFTMPGYRDPADRFLVATAKVHDFTLVTADERLMKIPGLKVLANR